MYSNRGVEPDAIRRAGVAYFHPPTRSDFHDEPFVWNDGSADAKMYSRCDIVIDSGSQFLEIKEVNNQLRQERLDHPHAILVVHMRGLV